MRRHAKRWVITVVAVMTVVMMAGAMGSAEKIVIEHFFAAGHGEAAQTATEMIIDLFHSEQEDIEVELTVVAGDYTEPILTRLIAGTPPDVITTSRVSDLLPYMLPLNAYVDRDDRFQHFVPPSIEQSTYEGQLVQLPIEISPLMTFYNKRLFAEAGLEDPTELHAAGRWTWDTMASAAQKIARRDEEGNYTVWGTNITAYSFERNHMWIDQAGGSYFDRLTFPQESRIQSPEVATAFEFMHSLAHEKQVMPADGLTSWGGYGQFINGESGMNFEGPWMIGQIMYTDAMTKSDWDVAPPAVGPAHGRTMTHTNGLQILRDSKNPDAAYEWIRFFTTDERAVEIYTALTGRPSAYLPMLREFQTIVAPDGLPANLNAIVETLIEGADPFMIRSTLADQLEAAFEVEIVKYFQGEQPLESTLELIHDQWQVIFSEAAEGR